MINKKYHKEDIMDKQQESERLCFEDLVVGESYEFLKDVSCHTLGIEKGTQFILTALHNDNLLYIKFIKGKISIKNHGYYNGEFLYPYEYRGTVENGLPFEDIENIAKKFGYKKASELNRLPLVYIKNPENGEYPFCCISHNNDTYFKEKIIKTSFSTNNK